MKRPDDVAEVRRLAEQFQPQPRTLLPGETFLIALGISALIVCVALLAAVAALRLAGAL